MNKIWNRIQTIKGKNSNTYGQDILTSEQDIPNKLGQTFSKNSSTANNHTEFKKCKDQNENKTKLNSKSKTLEEYNRPFSFDELLK